MTKKKAPNTLDAESRDVLKFHLKFKLWPQEKSPGFLTRRKMLERIKFLQEELDELSTAVMMNDLGGIADALVDLVYVAKGTALMMGLPWTRHWSEVHYANMEKVFGVGPRGNTHDVIKPPGWEAPNHARILVDHGFNLRDWLSPDGNLIDGRDDPGKDGEVLPGLPEGQS